AVGRDAFGSSLVAGLQDAGVDCDFVARCDDVETGTATIIRCEGDNRIVLSPGANHALAGEDVARVLRRLVADELDGDASEIAPAAGSVFIAQGECDLVATVEALVCAHELGFYTVFNPAPACEVPAEVWPAVDLVCPNETECQVLTGILPADDASCVAALNALLAKGAGAAVITLGGAGSVTLGDDGELLRMPALSSTVVDTTAAGDTFIGALAAARLEGLPLFECMAAGARASAVTVSRLGAQQSIPTRTEVERVFGLDDLVQDGEAE
ncbi:MAG: PfkB family carbohydrate kinase, partial [Collinsella sp.]|nr:PfkB family carbohydrate kinase [Collinsella sp.]